MSARTRSEGTGRNSDHPAGLPTKMWSNPQVRHIETLPAVRSTRCIAVDGKQGVVMKGGARLAIGVGVG